MPSGATESPKLFQDVLAYHDINAWAPVHFWVIPKEHVRSMAQLQERHAGLMGRIMTLIPKLALEAGCNPAPEGGFRVVCNNGDEGGQEVQHLHIDVISQLALAIPMCILYEVGLFASKFYIKFSKKPEEPQADTKSA
jgi:histidine triad (HIT) family protein